MQAGGAPPRGSHPSRACLDVPRPRPVEPRGRGSDSCLDLRRWQNAAWVLASPPSAASSLASPSCFAGNCCGA